MTEIGGMVEFVTTNCVSLDPGFKWRFADIADDHDEWLATLPEDVREILAPRSGAE